MATESDQHPPSTIPVTFNLRLPWRYKQQLQAEADKQGMSLHAIIIDALERRYRPAK